MIVRVIAAKDLRPIQQLYTSVGGAVVGSLRDVMSTTKSRMNHASSSSYNSDRHHQQRMDVNSGARRRRFLGSSGTANPYAIMSFSNQIETTSTVYDSLHPSFPRHEPAYFDVSLPIHHLAATAAHDDDGKSRKDMDTLKKKLLDNALPLPPPPQPPFLTVELSHDDDKYDNAQKEKDLKWNPKKAMENKQLSRGKTNDGHCNSNPSTYLGTASIDITHLITGKVTYIDEWLTLRPRHNNNNNNPKDSQRSKVEHDKKIEGIDDISGQVRIICEYDMTDIAPRPGDMVRFNGFVQPMDVFPIPATQVFRVDDIGSSDDDMLVLSYKSKPEDWYCSFVAHRFMFISVDRHISAVERYHEEIVDVMSKLVSSPASHALQNSVARLPEEGLIFMGLQAGAAGLGLVGRWFQGGVSTIVDDIVYATNLDGKNSVQMEDVSLAGGDGLSMKSSDEELELNDGDLSFDSDNDSESTNTIQTSSKDTSKVKQAAPSMPCCPISRHPMKEPVVAADGHTYERKAISRWFRTSNISPLTGQELQHKELVPNYLLISTFQNDE